MSFFSVEYDILDEINIGDGTQLRLAQNINTKGLVIQSWSSLSKQWNVMYRYKVEEAWASWKRTEVICKKVKQEKEAQKPKKVRKRG